MRHKILSSNIYIKHTLKHILGGLRNEKYYFIVDIDSYPSFTSLLEVLEKYQPEDGQGIILIKGKGIHSRVLGPLAAFGYDACLPDIISCLKKRKIPDWHYIRNHLSEMQEWSMMTPREMSVIRFIIKYPDIPTAAHALNANKKTVYSRVGQIARKLNLRNANEVRMLAMSECI